MKNNEGMGIEIPVWVIQSANGKRTFNRKINRFQENVSEDCIYNTPEDANSHLKIMDFGYVVSLKRFCQDAKGSRIW